MVHTQQGAWRTLTNDEGCSSHDHDKATTILLGQHHGHQRGKGTGKEEGAGEQLQDLVVVLHTATGGGSKQ